MLQKVLFVTLLCALLSVRAAAAPVDAQLAVRAEFRATLDAVTRGLPAENDSEALRAYVLYPYLQAERLQQSLALPLVQDINDVAVAAFLTEHGDAPWTRSLRAAWLRQLAERGDWSQFLAHYQAAQADLGLRCDQLNALINTGPDPSLIAPALEIWRTGSELPQSCASVFDWLKTQNALGLDQIAARTRLALENGKFAVARMLIAQLPETQRAPYELWIELVQDPQRMLSRAVSAGAEPRAILDAFAKLARSSHETATAVLARMEAQCGTPCALSAPASIGELRREIALNQAWSRLPESLGTFRQVPDTALDERGFEWRVRAALWADDWALAQQWLTHMPAALAAQPRWRYWLARSHDKLGQTATAAPLYQALTQENGYYALLASERLDRSYTPRAQTRASNPALRAQFDMQPAFVRAREAWLIEQNSWARSEWNQATANFTPEQLIEAARLASAWGWHLMAVATSTRAEVFDDFALLYPRPYETELREAARRARLPAEWIWGVLRQESLYDPRARSSADALGLLQLLPETARAVARRARLPLPTRAELFDPQLNLLLGAGYLREQFDTFGGRFVLVLGAYNAGPNAVRRWLPDAPLETDVWIENVPFNETRNYIQRIVWHSSVFGWLASGKPQRITPWMTPISADLNPLPNPQLVPTP
ncbi:MAG: transglycosylase SLT domain-containing protein [Panacagrimonas sp.]